MKYAILALVGAASAIRTISNQDKLFEYNLVQTEKIIEDLPPFSGWTPSLNGVPGTQNEYGDYFQPYNRDIPERFTGDVAIDSYPVDKFTQSMLNTYAVESIDGKGKDPKPSGKFYLTKDNARKAGAEVLATHFGLKGAEGEKFLALRYDDAWNYYDVNKTGMIDAVGVSQFFRYLTRPLGAIDLE